MTWERFTCEADCDHFPETCISEHLILSTADAMVEGGFVAGGYDYVQIDDCFLAGGRDANGNLFADPKRFPRGLKYVADYLHKRGMKLGLYGDVGTSTCCGLPAFNVSATPDPQADERLRKDVETFMSWGMDSIKVDGCNADAHMMNVTYPKLGAAMRAAAEKLNRPEPWYSCSWPDYVGDIMCNHGRIEPCVPLHQIAAECNSARVYSDIADRWEGDKQGIKDIVEFWAQTPQFAELRNGLQPGREYYNDPDELMVGNNGLSYTQAQVNMGMWVMFAAPLVMSTDVRAGKLRPEMKDILLNTEVLALADDPLGLQATLCTTGCSKDSQPIYGGHTWVWNKTLADNTVAVALLNTGNFGNVGPSFGDFNISFTYTAVGLDCPSGRFQARDLFARKELGTWQGGFWAEVDDSSMLLLRLQCVAEPAAAAAPLTDETLMV